MSSWVSCQKIVFNLHKSYQLNKEYELQNFNYSVDQTTDEIIMSARAVVAAKPDVLLILDHKPHPYTMLGVILPLLEQINHKPKIIFHVFGDFTLYYAHWEKLGKLLATYEVDFVVASDRQKHLIDKFLPEKTRSHVCPFPVDKHEFSFNPALRTLQRKEWGITDNDMAFIFTGRLSLQKRIHTLIQAFADLIENTKSENAHLFLYGNPDSVGDQFVGKWEIEGQYFRKINRIYKSLDPDIQKKIHFMGNVPNLELKAVYQGADMLVNLSVHNDEDYGMSVAEAQCSGLPSILTNWGGLASFEHKDLPDATRFVEVKIGRSSKVISYGSVVEALEIALKNGPFKNRAVIADKAIGRFGVEASHKIVAGILKSKTPPFTEFTPLFEKVKERFLISSTPYITDSGTINNLYRELYSSYVRNS